MSEAVTNAEIEDVLSSIRRLVSENAPTEGQSAVVDNTVEKLVLTPAFRVHEAEPVNEPVTLDVRKDHSQQDAGDIAEAEQVIVAEAPVILDAPIDPEAAAVRDDTVPGDPARGDIEPADTDLGDIEPPMDAAAMAAAWEAECTASETLEDRIAELEAAVEDTADDWEPDGSEDEAETPQTVVFEHASWTAPAAEAVEEAMVEEVMVDEVAEDAPFVETMPEEPLDEAPEAAIFDDDDSEEAVIDEDALRELVARLVREELQGTVGERITRNVRRLVRREIQRALTLKDFE